MIHIESNVASAPKSQASAEVASPSLSADQAALASALKRIIRLEDDLNECREFIEAYVDVNDGDYGEPTPNRAMSLVSMIDETLNGRAY